VNGAAIGWGALIGASLVAGGLVAAWLVLPRQLSAIVTAFGGGILLAAVALELVPDADERAGTWLTAAGLLGGALVYVATDALLTRSEGMEAMRRSAHAAASGRPMEMTVLREDAARGEAIAAGLFVDGIPESIALGLTVAEGELGVALLVGIVVGNVVEAYGAAQPIVASGRSKRFALLLLSAIGVAVALATVAGATVLSEARSAPIGVAQAVASGAVLAVISISIVPHAFAEVSRWVAVAATTGFVAGYLL
jgi:zinc transporter, ZIP family